MARIEKTVFISYRRINFPWALALFQDLTQHGYDVFIDYDGLASGNFESAILENIRARAHFLVLLTPTALERCSNPEDWMRREIEAAIKDKRNIVPLVLEGFDFGAPAIVSQLIAGNLAALKEYNGLEIPKAYFPQAMEKLRTRFLNVPLDAVLHSASAPAQQAATEQKDKAAMALRADLPEEIRGLVDHRDIRSIPNRLQSRRVWLIGSTALGMTVFVALAWVVLSPRIPSVLSQAPIATELKPAPEPKQPEVPAPENPPETSW
jgi:hypothetical protein